MNPEILEKVSNRLPMHSDPAAAAAERDDQGLHHRGQPGADHGKLEVGWCSRLREIC